MRLRYFARLLINGPGALTSILSVVNDGKRLPWVEQIVENLAMLKVFFSSRLGEMPDPRNDSVAWFELICSHKKQWYELIDIYNVYSSILDEIIDTADIHNTSVFTCDLCNAGGSGNVVVFKSSKALRQHQRIVHNIRSPIPMYIDDSGICPACNVDLGLRTKVITHACEARVRSKRDSIRCCDVILSGSIPKISHDLYIKLEERDRIRRRNDKRQGRTHAVAFKPAKRVACASINRRVNLVKRSAVCAGCEPPPPTKHFKTDCVPLRRISAKTSPSAIPLVPAKRLKTKSDHMMLCRRV